MKLTQLFLIQDNQRFCFDRFLSLSNSWKLIFITFKKFWLSWKHWFCCLCLCTYIWTSLRTMWLRNYLERLPIAISIMILPDKTIIKHLPRSWTYLLYYVIEVLYTYQLWIYCENIFKKWVLQKGLRILMKFFCLLVFINIFHS